MRELDLLSGCARKDLLDIDQQGDLFRPTSDDPQIIFNLAQPLSPGWYELTLEAGAQQRLRPHIQFDFGIGFHTIFSAVLTRSGATRYKCAVRLHQTVRRLRLDLPKSSSDVHLRRFVVRRVSGGALVALLMRKAIRAFTTKPVAFVQSIPFLLRSLGKSHFVNFRGTSLSIGETGYKGWIQRHDYIESRDRQELLCELDGISDKPLISVIMPVYNPPVRFLDQAIASVVNQVYENWQLCIADDHSTDPAIKACLEKWRRRDSRIEVCYRQENGHISEASNSAFALAKGSWVAMVDHDDILRPHALAEVALAIAPAARLPDHLL